MGKAKELTLASMAAAFGVSSNSVFLWRRGTATKEKIPTPYTPANLKRWAKQNGVPIAKDPASFLDKPAGPSRNGRGRPSAKKAAEKKPLKRSGSGKLSSVRGRSESVGATA